MDLYTAMPNLISELHDFFNEMKSRVIRKSKEGKSGWDTMSEQELKDLAARCLVDRKYVDAANFCAMANYAAMKNKADSRSK